MNTDALAKKTSEGWSSVSGGGGLSEPDVVANETFKEYYLVYLAVPGLGMQLVGSVPDIELGIELWPPALGAEFLATGPPGDPAMRLLKKE